jgi:NADH:ubiquinone oxidoreductase subunit D
MAHHGTGEVIEVDELTTDRLRGLIEKVFQDPSYRERADYFQRVISKTRGLDLAADIVEQAFQKYQTEVPHDSRSDARGKHKTPEEMQESMTDIVTASSKKLDNWKDNGPWYEGTHGERIAVRLSSLDTKRRVCDR